MTSKEIVRRAIEFRDPPRLPVRCPRFGYSDTHKVNWNQLAFGDISAGRESADEWGCIWQRSEIDNMGLVKGHPLDDWSKLDHYRFPDPDDPQFYAGIEKNAEGGEDKYLYFDIFMLLFERLHSLRGFENTLMDLYLEQEKIEKLADYVVEYDIRIMENMVARFPMLDGFTFTDDWGTQLNTFISHEMWCEFFKPRYKKIFDAAKRHGLHLWMHSCGKINAFIPDLIELGVNVLNLEQPRTVGIEEVGRLAAGKVAFATGCDIQHTLPAKGKEEIDEEIRLLMQHWGTEHGGLILADDENDEALGTPLWKKEYSIRRFLELDRWKQR